MPKTMPIHCWTSFQNIFTLLQLYRWCSMLSIILQNAQFGVSLMFHLCKLEPQFNILFTILYWKDCRYGSGTILWVNWNIMYHGAVSRKGKASIQLFNAVGCCNEFCITVQYNTLLFTSMKSVCFPLLLIFSVSL